MTKKNLKSILANGKNKLARKIGFGFLLASPFLLATSCKNESECNDAWNPDCENYDPKYTLRQDSIRLTNQFRQDFVSIDAVLGNSFRFQFQPRLTGNTLKDSINATDGAVDDLFTMYGNPMTGATEEQNQIANKTKQTCVDWFAVNAQLGHPRD